MAKKIKKKAKKKTKEITLKEPLSTILYLYAGDIPMELHDVCLEIDDEFPLHYSSNVVGVEDDGNAFSEWLKTLGFTFDANGYGILCVQGT